MSLKDDLPAANAAPRIGQARAHSLMEAVTGTLFALFISIVLQQFIIAPLFHLRTSVGENIGIVLIFTVVSMVRSYYWRRLFNWLHCRQHHNAFWNHRR